MSERAPRRSRRLTLLGVLAGLFVLVFALGDFLAPYAPQTQHRRLGYVPPMLGRIHLFEDGRLRWPFVYGLRRERDPELLGVWRYEEDPSQRYPLRFFVRGERYRFWGLFETDWHLFGVEPPGVLFVLGTNQTGQDLFSQILVGGRLSLALAPLVILSALTLGVLVGGTSGYLGGAVDTALQRLIEIAMGLPRLALLLALSAAVPPRAPPMTRFWAIAGVLTLVSWAPLARLVRGQVLALREQDFVLAARALGAGTGRLLARHLLPNVRGTLAVGATLAVPDVLILESVLSFLGFGLAAPLISWGLLLKQLQDNLITHLSFHPWLLTPGAFLFASVFLFNALGETLRRRLARFGAADGS